MIAIPVGAATASGAGLCGIGNSLHAIEIRAAGGSRRDPATARLQRMRCTTQSAPSTTEFRSICKRSVAARVENN
jgi:hypothetical protein